MSFGCCSDISAILVIKQQATPLLHIGPYQKKQQNSNKYFTKQVTNKYKNLRFLGRWSLAMHLFTCKTYAGLLQVILIVGVAIHGCCTYRSSRENILFESTNRLTLFEQALNSVSEVKIDTGILRIQWLMSHPLPVKTVNSCFLILMNWAISVLNTRSLLSSYNVNNTNSDSY